ncbi:MAG: hypothetical protein K2Z81_22675 [Cyanobacteria bacterium]|nr:hypothetical protein [Cyanobacteriota bacterium]
MSIPSRLKQFAVSLLMRFIPSKETAKELGKALLIRIGLVLSIAFTMFILTIPDHPQVVKDVTLTICKWVVGIAGTAWLAIIIYVIFFEKKKPDAKPDSQAP